MGGVDLQNFLSTRECRSSRCATWTPTTSTRRPSWCPAPASTPDWRELLQKEGDRIDSVNVAVPDHTHFSIAYSAIQRGKHVYCQKPLCHDVAEVRVLTQAAVKQGRRHPARHAGGLDHPRPHRRPVAAGKAGSARSRTPISARIGREPSKTTASRARVRPSARSRPRRLNWNLWLGTAPVRPYAPDIYHPTKWRAWQDFGTGWSGDIGCHIFDAVWKGLGLQPPLTVSAEVQESWKNSPARRADTWPQGDHIIWTFPGNEKIAGRGTGAGVVRRRILSARAHPQALLRRPARNTRRNRRC